MVFIDQVLIKMGSLFPFCPYCTRNISLNSDVEIAIKLKLEKEYMKTPEISREVLKYSVEECVLDLLKVLHSKGVDVHASNYYALRLSAEKGHFDIVKYLVDQGADVHAGIDYALRLSAERGRLDIVKYLAEQGVDVHADNDYALILSAESGHLDIVKYLAEQGANISSEPYC
jgi:ankyrin repeat protein